MATPLTRDTNYAPGSQVKSADLNRWQDMIIGGYHGERTKRIHWSKGSSEDLADADPWTVTDGQLEAGTTGSPTAWLIPLDMEDGQRIRRVRARVRTHATYSMEIYLKRLSASGSVTNLDLVNSTTGAGVAYETIEIDEIDDVVGVSGGCHAVYATPGALSSGLRLLWIEVDYDRLPP